MNKKNTNLLVDLLILEYFFLSLTYKKLYVYITGLVGRVFANSPGD